MNLTNQYFRHHYGLFRPSRDHFLDNPYLSFSQSSQRITVKQILHGKHIMRHKWCCQVDDIAAYTDAIKYYFALLFDQFVLMHANRQLHGTQRWGQLVQNNPTLWNHSLKLADSSTNCDMTFAFLLYFHIRDCTFFRHLMIMEMNTASKTSSQNDVGWEYVL